MRDVTILSAGAPGRGAQRLFLYIPPQMVNLYEAKELFGQPVEHAFPSAIDDIEDAGKCLALGQGTACVMHLMRVLWRPV